jgi:diguanylate cyclase (GGDEF)-like protein
MMSTAARSVASWDFAYPIAERPRALWARVQLALKRFLLGAPEEALLAVAGSDHAQTHVAVFALLTLPLVFAWTPGSAVARWAILFSLLSGLLVAARLESAQHVRANPIGVLGVGVLYAIALSGVASTLLGPGVLRVDPTPLLAAVVAGCALLATRSDPRLSVLGGVVGMLSLGGLYAFGAASTAQESSAPILIAAAAASYVSSLAALRGQRLKRLAVLDTASGALHATAFERCLFAVQRTARTTREPSMLARIEFSALPAIREAHGAAFADALMRWLASAIVDRFRATDLLGRTGDDEFSLVLQGTDHPGVEQRLARLREEFDTIEVGRGGLREPIALRVNYGLAAFPRESEYAAAAQGLAGQRLELAKWRARHAA